MKIKETFLALTMKTFPYGYEEELEIFLPKGYFKDEHGNYYYKIGESKTAFTCHLDTACKAQVNVTHVFDKNYIRTNGKSILGADDKAGMTVLLYMIEKNVPGLYCFFIGEEVGCIGSSAASKDDMFKNYNRMISFDRRGTGSIITYQSSQRCCSDKFANELAKQYNSNGMMMAPDDTGVYTDSAEFTGVISECTNISVGYYKEHTHEEHQDLAHLVKLCNASVKIDWENLPTERDTKNKEYKNYYKSEYSTYDSYHPTGRFSSRSGSSRRLSSRAFREYDDWYDETPKSKWKTVKNKPQKIYLDTLENDITDSFSQRETKFYYESLKQMLFDDKLTVQDFEIIKEQYLDMNDPKDQAFYDDIIFHLS
jgi:hypothetical protein